MQVAQHSYIFLYFNCISNIFTKLLYFPNNFGDLDVSCDSSLQIRYLHVDYYLLLVDGDLIVVRYGHSIP